MLVSCEFQKIRRRKGIRRNLGLTSLVSESYDGFHNWRRLNEAFWWDRFRVSAITRMAKLELGKQ